MDKCYGDNLIDLFPRERVGRLFEAGSSGSGKSELVTRIVRKYSYKFYKILICGTLNHPIQDIPQLRDKVIVSKEIIDPEAEIDVFQKNKKLSGCI